MKYVIFLEGRIEPLYLEADDPVPVIGDEGLEFRLDGKLIARVRHDSWIAWLAESDDHHRSAD